MCSLKTGGYAEERDPDERSCYKTFFPTMRQMRTHRGGGTQPPEELWLEHMVQTQLGGPDPGSLRSAAPGTTSLSPTTNIRGRFQWTARNH